jgi:hypothetical protein
VPARTTTLAAKALYAADAGFSRRRLRRHDHCVQPCPHPRAESEAVQRGAPRSGATSGGAAFPTPRHLAAVFSRRLAAPTLPAWPHRPSLPGTRPASTAAALLRLPCGVSLCMVRLTVWSPRLPSATINPT